MSPEGVMGFVARVLERDGALIARAGEGALEGVLPEDTRRLLELEEFAVLGDPGGKEPEENGATPCGYGSDTLRRIAALAIGAGRCAAFRVEAPPSTPKDPDVFTGLNLSFSVRTVRQASSWTLLGAARYQATCDDEKLGLVEAAVAAPESIPVPVPALGSLDLAPLAPGEVAAEGLSAAFPALLGTLRRGAADLLDEFRQAVARRRHRDAERVERYFRDVQADLKRRLRRRGGEALAGKLASLPAERERRLAQLESDSQIRVALDLVALIALTGPAAMAELEVRRRKHRRILEARYDGVARRWIGLRCEGCGQATMAFALCDEAAHVLCAECWASCGTGGHRPCFRCAGKPEREPWAAAGAEVRSARPPTAEPPREHFPEEKRGITREEAVAHEEEDPLRQAVAALLRRFRVPLSSEEIRTHVSVDPSTLRRLLPSLVEEGLVSRIGAARGTRYFSTGDRPRGT